MRVNWKTVFGSILFSFINGSVVGWLFRDINWEGQTKVNDLCSKTDVFATYAKKSFASCFPVTHSIGKPSSAVILDE